MKQQAERMLIGIENKGNQGKPVCSGLLLFIVINAALTKICFVCTILWARSDWQAEFCELTSAWLTEEIPGAPASPALCSREPSPAAGLSWGCPRLQLLQKKLLLVAVRPDHTDREHGESSQQCLHIGLVIVFFKTWSEQDKMRMQ